LNIFQFPVLGSDSETTGLVYPKDYAYSVSFAAPTGDTLFVDLRTDRHLIPALQKDINNFRGRFVFHNAQFDCKMLKQAGIIVPLEKVDCTVVRACQINEHEGTVFPWTTSRAGSYQLDDLAWKYLRERKDDPWQELADMFGGKPTKAAQILNMIRAPRELLRRYQDKDALLALRLWMWQEDEIKRQGLQDIIAFEAKVFPVLARRAMAGIRVDQVAAEKAIDKLTVVIDQEQAKFESEIGIPGFNVNSAGQVKKLFDPKQNEHGDWVSSRTGSVVGKTEKGGASINAKILHAMTDPVAKSIVELRSLIKTRDTFLSGHILGHMHGDRVYPTINQSKGEEGGTGTGRLSYQDPAMQQIPNRNKTVAEIVKECFLPEHGQVWLSTDMNSFEVRVFAHLVSLYNPALLKIYEANPATDFHQYVADLMGVPRNPVRAGQANAKQLNLAMIFNSGKGAIAEEVGMPYTWEEFEAVEYGQPKTIRYKKAGAQAEAMIAEYHRNVPGVATLAQRAKDISLSRGYIKTFTGRRLRCPKGYKSYKQSGLLIQATSADFNKTMWIGTEDPLAELGGSLILNTHDSFDASVDDPVQAYKAMQEVARAMPSRVPLLLDLNGHGVNWWDAIRKDKK